MKTRLAIVALLILAPLATLASVGSARFTLWDDQETIWRNPRFNPPGLENLAYYWGHAHMDLYVPVTYSFWQILGILAWQPTPDVDGIRLGAGVFHVANLLLHACNTVLLWLILRRLVQRDWAAAAGALLFALHPLQVETVAWISGGKDLLCGFFVLLALWQYLLFLQPPASEPSRQQKKRKGGDPRFDRRWVHYVIASAAFVLGFFSKPTAVVTPLLAALLYILCARWAPAKDPLRRWHRFDPWLIPWLAIALGFVAVTKLVQPASYVDGGPLWGRPLIALDSLAFYLYKLIFPLTLSIDYGRTPAYVLSHWWAAATWLAPVALAVFLWMRRRRLPLVAAGGLWFVIGLLPVLGLVTFLFQHLSTTADHYVYLSLGGVALAAAAAVAQRSTKSVGVLCAMVLLLLAVRSAFQARYWHDSVALFEHAVAVTPQSPWMRNALGTAYEQQASALPPERAAPEWNKAAEQYRRAIELNPGHLQARWNLASVLGKQGRFAESLETVEALWEMRHQAGADMEVNWEEAARMAAWSALQSGHWEQAQRWAGEVLRLHPGDGWGQQVLEAARSGQR